MKPLKNISMCVVEAKFMPSNIRCSSKVDTGVG